MRIRCQDALADIIYKALSQDHPGVLKKQRASYNDALRPCDVIHPDFQPGHSAYFGISVCSTTQPAYISSSSASAGVDAAAGELAKDEKHLAVVEKVGADFIYLVMETFEVWMPFVLHNLHIIAVRTIPRSGFPPKFTRKSLLQQLFVVLWSYNAKMILQHWALQGPDDDNLLFLYLL